MTERLHFHFSLSCIGEGNGNPLPCSCLENPRERGAWWAAADVVGDDDRDGPQEQEWRQHPIEDFAKQGIGVGGTRLAFGGGLFLRPAPPRQAHQVFPGSSRDLAR